MTQWERIVQLLEKIAISNAEISNQNLELIDKLELIRVNTMNSAKNTRKIY